MAKLSKSAIVVVALAGLVGIGRVAITPRLTSIPTFEGTYEPLAHMLVGFLILVSFYDKKQVLGPSKLYGWIGWSLSLWELLCFVVQKF